LRFARVPQDRQGQPLGATAQLRSALLSVAGKAGRPGVCGNLLRCTPLTSSSH